MDQPIECIETFDKCGMKPMFIQLCHNYIMKKVKYSLSEEGAFTAGEKTKALKKFKEIIMLPNGTDFGS